MLTTLFFTLLSMAQVVFSKYTRTVIQERDMYREEAEGWQHTTHAFIRACGKSGSFGVEAKQCRAGIVLKAPIRPGCVCVRGVWVVHLSLCKAAPIIIMGGQQSSYDCYYIDHEVRSFLFIGDPVDPFKTKAYVTPQNMHVFQEIPLNGSWSPMLDFRDPVFLLIRRASASVPVFEDEEDKFCFKYRVEANKNYANTDGVVIWTTALLPTRYRRVPEGSKCVDPDNMGYDAIATHKEFYYYGFRGVPLVAMSCFEPCSIWPKGKALLLDSREERLNPKETKTYAEWLEIFRNETEAKKAKKSRNKRRVTNCEMVWDGHAYCMSSYWDASDKFEMPEKQRLGCFPEVGKNIRGSKKLNRYGRRRRSVQLHVYHKG